MAALQSQDIILAIYLLAEDSPWTFQSLSDIMGISTSQVHLAWGRLTNSKLADSKFRRPIKRNLLEFLEHGVKYSFPPRERGIGAGMATGHVHPAMKSHLVSPGEVDRFVWTNSTGRTKGVCVDPIHKSAVNVSQANSNAYAILAVLDSIRLGKAREQAAATAALKELVK